MTDIISGMAGSGGIKIIAVTPGGLAAAANVSPGDVLLEVNGETLLDNLNYQFLVSQRDSTEILLKKPGGALFRAVLENWGDGLGLELADDEIRICKQNCVFCFVRQMPPGFRQSLYIKDEDIRLSFLYGHFTTLSNSDNVELDRIIRERLSPIHVSVHATDPGARGRIVGAPGQGDILRKIDRLIDGGVEIHAQAVIAPGYNDGEIWEHTLADMWGRRGNDASNAGKQKGGVISLSCVPVGLTAHRQNLPPIQAIDAGYASGWVRRWKRESRRYTIGGKKRPWLLLADEWFSKAGMKAPGRKYYPADWNQIENGIGLIRRFQEHSRRFIKSDRAGGFAGLRLLLLTGHSFAPYLSQTIEALRRYVDAEITVVPVPNSTFGESVTVAGLLCGRDLLSAAQNNKRAANGQFDAIIIPSASVRRLTSIPAAAKTTGPQTLPCGHCNQAMDTYQFLDDMTVAEMESRLGLPVIQSGDNLSSLLGQVARQAPSLLIGGL